MLTREQIDNWNAGIDAREEALFQDALSKIGSCCGHIMDNEQAAVVARRWDTLTDEQKTALFPVMPHLTSEQINAFAKGTSADAAFKLHDTELTAHRPMGSPQGRIFSMKTKEIYDAKTQEVRDATPEEQAELETLTMGDIAEIERRYLEVMKKFDEIGPGYSHGPSFTAKYAGEIPPTIARENEDGSFSIMQGDFELKLITPTSQTQIEALRDAVVIHRLVRTATPDKIEYDFPEIDENGRAIYLKGYRVGPFVERDLTPTFEEIKGTIPNPNLWVGPTYRNAPEDDDNYGT